MGGTLMSAAQLAQELASPEPPTLLDARWSLAGPPGIEEFRAGHVPGAVFVDLDRDLAAPPGSGGRHPLPDASAFAAAMRRSGVSGARPVVVYDGGDGSGAARCWWLLRHHGHPSVRVLDGGVGAWSALGLPLATGDAPEPASGDFTPAAEGLMPILDAGDVLEFAGTGLLLDARAPRRYRGEAEPVDPVAGHIPGARNAPATANLDPATGRFLAAASLADLAARAGAVPGRAVAVYCGSGVTAAQSVLALAVAGVPASLYPGSWSHWIRDPNRPVAVGPEPG
ncbi:MAG TPA: sulfurtransferase [Candidatus Dormibacteraeota bacterium]|nr:sulfurtransferase [Candidatus Dormibacteraeota bacterium]